MFGLVIRFLGSKGREGVWGVWGERQKAQSFVFKDSGLKTERKKKIGSGKNSLTIIGSIFQQRPLHEQRDLLVVACVSVCLCVCVITSMGTGVGVELLFKTKKPSRTQPDKTLPAESM